MIAFASSHRWGYFANEVVNNRASQLAGGVAGTNGAPGEYDASACKYVTGFTNEQQGENMPSKNVVLVAGVHGVSGRAAAEHWASIPDTQVYGLARRSAPLPAGVEALSADLLDRDDLQRKLGKTMGITHVVFGAYIEKPTFEERGRANVAILRNLLDVLEVTSPSLRHVTFYQGGKAYGADLGPFKTPAREDDPRLMPPNFYYDQEDFLRERQRGKAWHWTALRPEATTGFGLGNPMNLGMSIAVYGAISKELGLPLRFPGTEKSYSILYQITSTIKARRAGFHDCIDTEEMFETFFAHLRQNRVIP